jgi:hypothetical protein
MGAGGKARSSCADSSTPSEGETVVCERPVNIQLEWGRSDRRPRSQMTPLALLTGLLLASGSQAGVVCPDSSYVIVDFACRFTGAYRTGEPKDVVTITPGPDGETLAENGITIRAYLRDCEGRPMVGVPADSVFLSNTYLCSCYPGGTSADGPTDSLGCATFTGTLRGGGCWDELYLGVGCTIVAEVPVKTNSPDITFVQPCHVGLDESSNFGFNVYLGRYTICYDFNEDGSLDAADYAQFVSRYMLQSCEWRRPPCPLLQFLPGGEP